MSELDESLANAAHEIAFHPKKFQISVLGLLIWCLIFGAPGFVIGLLIAIKKGIGLKSVFLMCSSLIIFAIGFLYLQQQKKHYRCLLEHDGVRLLNGVWWQTETFVPASRIQHTEVIQGPLQRRWEMAELELHTAGTHVGKIKISGIFKSDALAIRDLLLHRRSSE